MRIHAACSGHSQGKVFHADWHLNCHGLQVRLWVNAGMKLHGMGFHECVGSGRGALAHAGAQGSLGGLFAARSASRRPFSNPAASAVSIMNNTAVDIFQNIAQFAGNAAVAMHDNLGFPAAAPHDDAASTDGGATAGGNQSTAAGGSAQSLASAAASAGNRASQGLGTDVHGAHLDASAAGNSAGSMADNGQAPGAASMQNIATPAVIAADQSTQNAGYTAQGSQQDAASAGAAADGMTGSAANSGQAPSTTSMQNSATSAVAAADQSPSWVGGNTSTDQNAAAAGAGADGRVESMLSNGQSPPAASLQNQIGSVVAAANQSAMKLAASTEGHILAVEQLANHTDSTVKALLPASKAELQQQGDRAQEGEAELQRELEQQDAALRAQLKQQNARLRRQERATRQQADQIMQQNVTITELVKQVNMNTTNNNGPRVVNGSGGSTGAPALGANHMRAPHAACTRVQGGPCQIWPLRSLYA